MTKLNVTIIGLLLLLQGLIPAVAKEVKPTLLVYGSNIEAFAAAMQAARSNVPTLWVCDEASYLEDLNGRPLSVTSNVDLLGGVWKDLIIEMGQLKSKDDSTVAAFQRDVNPRLLRNALERMVSKQKNLTLVAGVKILNLSKGKKDLTVTLSNKRKYAVRAMVDASLEAESRKFLVSTDLFAKPSRILAVSEMTDEQRRTLVAIGEYEGIVYGYTWGNLFSRSVSNVFYVNSLVQVALDDNSLPLRANLGQAIGASAAYCSFFKTSADKVDVRKLQTELFAFDSRIMPFSDVTSSDYHYKSLQKIFLVSLLPFKNNGNELVFRGEGSVGLKEVKDVFNSLYSRSQLWFVDNGSKEYFELKELLTLIKYVSFRGDEVDREVEKEWSKKLKFEGHYDPSHVVTRYEFAVLVDRYADPYVKAVNAEGKILR